MHAFTEFLAKLFGSRPRWDRTAIASAACFLTLRSPNLRSRLTALGKPETIALFSIDSNHRSGDEIEQSLVPEDSQHGTCLDPRHIGCGSWSCFCPRQNAADAEPNVVRAPGKYGRLPDPDANGTRHLKLPVREIGILSRWSSRVDPRRPISALRGLPRRTEVGSAART